ncbi:MAG: hypothetical protein U0W40_19290 [Acidimicrobiia bacterium]
MVDHLELGHALVTMIEPDRDTIVAYNEWYERDHFLSGVLTGPGAFAGRRFAATRDLKALRFPEGSPVARPLDDGSFVTLYWIEQGQLGAHCDWGFPEAARLAGLGRMNTDRHHVSTAYYDLAGTWSAHDDGVPVELALHHPYAGLVVVWEATASADSGRQLLAADLPIDRVVTLRPIELPDPLPAMPGVIVDAPADAPGPSDVVVHCCFLTEHPAAGWEGVAARIGAVTDPLLVAPFVPTVPGTRTYLDELW